MGNTVVEAFLAVTSANCFPFYRPSQKFRRGIAFVELVEDLCKQSEIEFDSGQSTCLPTFRILKGIERRDKTKGKLRAARFLSRCEILEIRIHDQLK